MSDVEADAVEFAEEVAFLEEINADAPVMKVGDETVPVSLRLVFDGSEGSPILSSRKWFRRAWRGHPFFYEYAYEVLRGGLREESPYGFTSMNRQEARFAFVRRATDFVTTRIASVRSWRQHSASTSWHGLSMLTLRQRLRGPHISTPGCTFTVTSNAGGLRVFWSGAYYVSPNYFAHPTSPASAVLQSGTYIFGVDGGAYGSSIQWDPNAIIALPGSPFVHLNY
jgi:hypothetical protein